MAFARRTTSGASRGLATGLRPLHDLVVMILWFSALAKPPEGRKRIHKIMKNKIMGRRVGSSGAITGRDVPRSCSRKKHRVSPLSGTRGRPRPADPPPHDFVLHDFVHLFLLRPARRLRRGAQDHDHKIMGRRGNAVKDFSGITFARWPTRFRPPLPRDRCGLCFVHAVGERAGPGLSKRRRKWRGPLV